MHLPIELNTTQEIFNPLVLFTVKECNELALSFSLQIFFSAFLIPLHPPPPSILSYPLHVTHPCPTCIPSLPSTYRYIRYLFVSLNTKKKSIKIKKTANQRQTKMPAKRKYPGTPAPPTLASTRSRRFPPFCQTDTEPALESQSQDNSVSLDSKTTKASEPIKLVKKLRFVEKVEAEDDVATVFKKPRHDVTIGLSLIQSKLECTSITSSSLSSTAIVSGMKRLGVDNSEDTKNAAKRPRRSARAHQPQTEDNAQDRENDAYIISASKSATAAVHSTTQRSLPSLPEEHQGPEASNDLDIPELVRSQPYSGPRKPRTQLAQHLPPLWNLSDIFKSLTGRAIELNLDDVLSHLGARRLRVVTVCSGTESPLLALEMVRESKLLLVLDTA